jgi:hypothetical protein
VKRARVLDGTVCSARKVRRVGPGSSKKTVRSRYLRPQAFFDRDADAVGVRVRGAIGGASGTNAPIPTATSISIAFAIAMPIPMPAERATRRDLDIDSDCDSDADADSEVFNRFSVREKKAGLLAGFFSLRWESNPQPQLYESCALPLSHSGSSRTMKSLLQ